VLRSEAPKIAKPRGGQQKGGGLMKDKAHLTNEGFSEIEHIIGGMNLRRSG
jgi:hypothetical protein